MTDLRTNPTETDLSFVKDQLASLERELAKLTLRHASQVETDLTVLRRQVDVLLSELRKIGIVAASLGSRFDVAIQFHERLAALEARVESLPPRHDNSGGNGRFHP